jgi:short-subunit dehydrogenase
MQQTILIVGATSGLGQRLCELYVREGHKVGAVGRRKILLDELSRNYPQKLVPFPYDISNEDCESSIKAFIEQLGGIDKLILTASGFTLNPSLSLGVEKEMFATNIYGYAAVLNAAYHYFVQKGSGHIIGVTSIAAARGNSTTPAYNACKAFQSSYLESLRLKLHSMNKPVFVTELIPGYMDTQMAKGDRLFWVASLQKAGRQAKSAIDKKKPRAYITRRWKIIYLILKFLPSPIYRYLITSRFKLQKQD